MGGKDKPIIAEILRLLNPAEADASWTWTNDEDKDWDFKAMQVLENNALGSLALHMLHRHGLGPLLASGVETSMEERPRKKRRTTSAVGFDGVESDLQIFVDRIEQLEPVKRLYHLLESLTLPGLRSLHSYDHEWSTSHRNILQAGHSAHVYKFMQSNGFTKGRCEKPIADLYKVHKKIFSYSHEVSERISQIDRTFIYKYASAKHTGRVTSRSTEIVQGWTGRAHLTGIIDWEDGASTQVKFELGPADVARFKAYGDSDLQRALVVLTTEYIDNHFRLHRAELAKTRLVWWTGEECEFAGMYAELQKPAYLPKFDATGNPL